VPSKGTGIEMVVAEMKTFTLVRVIASIGERERLFT
jgi:hypothetical protein